MTVEARPVVVVGLGYVGCVTAACLAKLGRRVIGVDCVASKVEAVGGGHAPFYEPGLDELVKENVAAGRLCATTSLGEALEGSEIALICVGGPGLDDLHRVVREIAAAKAPERRLIVAVRTTLFPGACEELVAPALGDGARTAVVANPEFLREGSAVRDFLEASLVVVGGSDRAAVERVAQLYAPIGAPQQLVSARAAELIKHACNSFHAVKIAFANEIGALGAGLGVDAGEVMHALCQDLRLNVSPAYLKPGFAFGGSCLSKDQRALVCGASRLGLRLPLLEAVLPSNQEHLGRAVARVLALPEGRIGVYGLAFKEDTDDVRGSAALALVARLIGAGRSVRVFDPHVRLDGICGANRQFALDSIPDLAGLLDARLDDLLAWAERLVLTRTPPPEMAERIRRAAIPILDLAAAGA